MIHLICNVKPNCLILIFKIKNDVFKNHKFHIMKSLLTYFLVLSSSMIFAQGINFAPEDAKWADILAKAKSENKIVFVDAYTSWCGPCKHMAKNVFPVKEVGDVFNASFVNAKIDMEKGEGVEIAQKYKIYAYPTYIFVNGDGELVHKSLGMMPPEKFIEVGKAALNPENQFITRKRKFEKGEKDPEFLKKFSYECSEQQEPVLAAQVASAYIATQKDWLTDENKAYILQFARVVESPLYLFVLNNRVEFEKSFSKDNIKTIIENTALESVANYSFDRKLNGFDIPKATLYANKYLPKEIADKTLSFMQLREYQMKKDIPNFVKQTVFHYDNFPTDDPNLLIQNASLILQQFTEKSQLESAAKWAEKAVSIANTPQFSSVAASIYSKLGNEEKAKTFLEKK